MSISKSGGTIYVRVVPQDRNNGYMLLVGYDSAVVQRTAITYSTISNPTRAYLEATIQRVRDQYTNCNIKDVTSSGITKRLMKLFGETTEKLKDKNAIVS